MADFLRIGWFESFGCCNLKQKCVPKILLKLDSISKKFCGEFLLFEQSMHLTEAPVEIVKGYRCKSTLAIHIEKLYCVFMHFYLLVSY